MNPEKSYLDELRKLGIYKNDYNFVNNSSPIGTKYAFGNRMVGGLKSDNKLVDCDDFKEKIKIPIRSYIISKNRRNIERRGRKKKVFILEHEVEIKNEFEAFQSKINRNSNNFNIIKFCIEDIKGLPCLPPAWYLTSKNL